MERLVYAPTKEVWGKKGPFWGVEKVSVERQRMEKETESHEWKNHTHMGLDRTNKTGRRKNAAGRVGKDCNSGYGTGGKKNGCASGGIKKRRKPLMEKKKKKGSGAPKQHHKGMEPGDGGVWGRYPKGGKITKRGGKGG